MNHRHNNRKIKKLEDKIEFLNMSLNIARDMHDNLQKAYDEINKERINYRRLMKYHTLLLMLMDLLSNASGDTDIDRIVKRNIHEYIRKMNLDLTQIRTNYEVKFDDEEGGYAEG